MGRRGRPLCLPERIVALIVGLIVHLSTTAAFAQIAKPDAVVNSALARLTRRDWGGFAACIHPTALQEFKFYVIKITAVRLQTGANDRSFDLIFGRPTLEEVKNAPAEVLLTNFLHAAVEAAPDFGRVLTQTKYERLGVVDEGTAFKHVVARFTYGAGDTYVKRVEVITLQKGGAAWKALLPPFIETFLNELGWPKLDK
jgi:hypothetical protein